MGHSDSTVTLEVFSHFIPDTQEKVVFALNNISKNDCKSFFEGNLPFPASGSPSARIWQAILTNQGRFTREYQKDECKFCIRLFWYSRRESNPQLTLRRGLLYPFNYGSVYSVFSLFLDCTTFFKLCQFF